MRSHTIVGTKRLTPTSVPFCSAQANRSPFSTAWNSVTEGSRLALDLPTADHLELGVGLAQRDEDRLVGETLAVQQLIRSPSRSRSTRRI